MAERLEREVQLHTTMDAEVWAREFMLMLKKEKAAGKPLEIDHGLMLTWFANAIMTGYDHANWRRDRTDAEHQLGDAPGSHWIHDRADQTAIETFVEGYPGSALPITALRYALRAATQFGKTDRIDPDAVEQAFVRILVGERKPAHSTLTDDLPSAGE